MELREFHNRLRILTSIDMHELIAAGVIDADDEDEWNAFCKAPHKWMIQADDDQAEALWALMKKRGA